MMHIISVLGGKGEQKYELSQRAAADGVASRPPRHTDNSVCAPSLREQQKYVDFCTIIYATVWRRALVSSNLTEAPLLLSNDTKQCRPLLSHLAEHHKGSDGWDDHATHGMQCKHHLEEERNSTVKEQILMERCQKSFDRP